MSRYLLPMVWLTLVWTALWESFSFADIVGGILVAAATLLLVPPRKPGHQVGFRLLAAIRLISFFSWQLVVASLQVAWEVITPWDKTRPAVVSVPLSTRVPFITTAVANMVSLVPGTLTIEVDPDEMTLYIHILHFKSLEETRSEVAHLERLSLAAFPPRGDHS